MAASVRSSRIDQIARCADEIDGVTRSVAAGIYAPVAIINTLGQVDWMEELHRLLYDYQPVDENGRPRHDHD